VLDEYRGKEKRPHIVPEHPTQNLTVSLTEAADLFENLEAISLRQERSPLPRPMEDYGQNYGLILYSTNLNAFNETHMKIQPYKYKDRANIYVDGDWFATYMRDRGCRGGEKAYMSNGIAALAQNGEERKIDVLVENLGRLNYGKLIADERKGMEGGLLYGNVQLFGYDTRTIPLDDLSRLDWKENSHTDHMPCFFKGRFDAKSGVDTYVSFENLGHGYVWINGFNLGRYDSAGPQMTLYLPGHFLNEKDNEIIILDIDPVGERSKIEFLDHEILEGDSDILS
jgi:beta-galactosidase